MGVSENNKRIAKNTIALYLRMLFSMGVSLYTSRAILDALGVSDFGIYSVVGGVVGLLGFLNSSLSGATSRFLTFELGRGDREALRRVFSCALAIHFAIAATVLVFAETAGLWLLENKLTFPPERLPAARLVLHFSVAGAMVAITQIPYTASILSHERMGIYARVSVAEVCLRLGIVFLLVKSPFDKLCTYAALMFSVSAGTALFYRFYCRKNFAECRFRFGFSPETLRPILAFSVWDLLGNLSVVARTQGVNVLQNLFFGPVVNVAAGIAGQVQGAVSGFSGNFLSAVRPQIVKYYARGEISEMQNLICRSGKISVFLMFFLSLPLILECEFVLGLWLKNVPEYTATFVKLTLCNQLVSVAFRTMMFSIHATGRIRTMSFINGATYLLVIPLSYWLLKNGFSPATPFVLNIVLLSIGCLSNTNLVRRYIPLFSAGTFLREVVLRGAVFAGLACVFPWLLSRAFPPQSIARFFAVGFACVVCCVASAALVLFNKAERNFLFGNLKLFWRRKFYEKNANPTPPAQERHAQGLVSIVSPCWNGEKFVHRLLESVLAQDYPAIELIVVNDGSTDGTAGVLARYAEKFRSRGFSLRTVFQENAGQAVALERGLQWFSGNFLIWVDSDDYFSRADAVSKFVRFLNENPDAGFAVCNCARITPGKKPEPMPPIVSDKAPPARIFAPLFTEKIFFTPGRICVRREIFLKANPTRTLFHSRQGQNYQMEFPIAFVAKCGFISEELFCYVMRADSHSHTTPANIARISGLETVKIETLKRIAMPEKERERWIKIARLIAARRRREFYFRNFLRESFSILRQWPREGWKFFTLDLYRFLCAIGRKILRKIS